MKNREDHRGDGARASCDVGTMTPPRERASSSSRAREATSSDGDDATGAFAIGDDDNHHDRLDVSFLDEVVDDFLVEPLVVDGFEDEGGDVDGLLTPSMFRACGYFDVDGLGELGELGAGADGAASEAEEESSAAASGKHSRAGGSSSSSSLRGRKRSAGANGESDGGNGKSVESEEERLLRLSRNRERNRESAQNSRARKREYVRDLEKRARALEMQNGELQAMVMHLTNENHALRMNLQVAGGGAMPTMMMPCVYPPMTPKLPLPPMGAEPAVEAPPSPQLEVKKPTTKRRKQTVAASVTALALGALSVAGVTSPGSSPAGAGVSSRSSSRRLLALSAPPTEDPLLRFGVNVTSLREEIARTDDERVFALPDAVTTRGLAAWGDKTFDGRAVDVVRPSNVNDPWFSAFKSAGMPEHVNLLSRVSCKEVFKFKGADEGASVAPRTNADAWPRERRDEDKLERGGQYSNAIPMLSGKENETSIPEHKDIEGAEESLVSVLLPPPIEGVVQQLSKLFVVTFNKRTTDYTTHSCLLPQPVTSTNRHL